MMCFQLQLQLLYKVCMCTAEPVQVQVKCVLCSIPLSSAVSPFILDTSPRTEALINVTSVAINCTIRGFPLSSVVWAKDGVERPPNVTDITVTTLRLQDGMTPYPFHNSMSTEIPPEELEYFDAVSILNITRPTVRGDTANYTCMATSMLGLSVLSVTSDNIPLFILGELMVFSCTSICVGCDFLYN